MQTVGVGVLDDPFYTQANSPDKSKFKFVQQEYIIKNDKSK